MNINRHNYEEYFILYMDNELGSEERRMVEAFIQQHPDLEEELDLLRQFKLTPDNTIIFEGKEELLKQHGDAPVTLHNYEEWFLLYTDNELDNEQKASVEHFLSANPQLRPELALLQRSRLEPEEIIFADKASLYRTADTDNVKPFPVRWWRLAAAAVLLIGISITTVILVGKKSPAEKEVAKTAPEKKTTAPQPVQLPQPPNSPVNAPELADNNSQVTVPVINEQAKLNTVTGNEKNTARKQPVNNTIIPEKTKEIPVMAVNNNKPSNELPQPVNNPNINKNDAATNAIASMEPKENNKQKDALTTPNVTTEPTQSSDIIYASNKNTDDADIDQADSKKNKNRGFFRKLTRTFEKRTNMNATDDDRLLIAGLSIKLK